jgi:hypothetical protein
VPSRQRPSVVRQQCNMRGRAGARFDLRKRALVDRCPVNRDSAKLLLFNLVQPETPHHSATAANLVRAAGIEPASSRLRGEYINPICHARRNVVAPGIEPDALSEQCGPAGGLSLLNLRLDLSDVDSFR